MIWVIFPKLTFLTNKHLKFPNMFTFGICVCHLPLEYLIKSLICYVYVLNPLFKVYSECKNENRHFICSLS